jgi:DNA-binding transcriptional LysR family regulator
MMNLRQLSHLIALADEGRFVAAAERVHLSQAAFSRSIQSLEEHFGLRLFERGPQGATLTPAGRTLVERARRLMFDSRCLERDAQLLRQGELGELCFGVGPIPAAVLVPRLLAEMRRKAPQVIARVRNGNVASLLALLQAEAIDFFVADPRLIVRETRLDMVPLMRIVGGLYCRPGHPLLQQSTTTPEDLRRHGIGMVSARSDLLVHVAQTLGFDGLEAFPLAVECDDLHTLSRLALEGDLLALLPQGLAADFGMDLRELRIAAAQSALFADVHAIWLSGRTLSPAADLAIRECQALALEWPRLLESAQ